MRILLVHNPKAGSEEHEGEDFIKALKRAGHKATYQSSKKKGITKALKKKIDLVLVAGGDGTGLFADYLRASKRDESTSKAEAMRSHVKELRRRLQTYRARQWEIEVEGSDLSGRYLLWHAMNIRSVGPVLTLAADAKTNDGSFDFVGAREEDRALLLDYFDARVAGKRRKFLLRRN